MSRFHGDCYKCGKPGHSSKNCYQNSSSGGFFGTCYKCGKPGHSKKNCPGTSASSPSSGQSSFTSTVRCYDCNAQVVDLKQHRATDCPNSRLANSRLSVLPSPVDNMDTDGFEQTPIPKTVVDDTTDWYALIDVSSSMMGARLQAAKTALLKEIEPEMAENDRLAIVTFDTKAFFKLKPRAVGQLRRQQELAPLLDRIFARGATAIWDAIWLAVSQLRDKTRRTLITVLTDGEDNSSQHTYAEVLSLVEQNPNVELSIVHVSNIPHQPYNDMCTAGRGKYAVIDAAEIEIAFSAAFRVAYRGSAPLRS